MKALEILNKYKNLCVGIYLGDDYSDGVDSYSKDIEECDEAIKELEAFENGSCEGCIYLDKSNCINCLSCKRRYSDNWRNK